jgi:hypothetical protein
VAEAIGTANGMDAANLKVAELYVQAFGNLAREGNTLIVPANLADMSSLVGSAMTVLDGVRKVRDTTSPAPGARASGA